MASRNHGPTRSKGRSTTHAASAISAALAAANALAASLPATAPQPAAMPPLPGSAGLGGIARTGAAPSELGLQAASGLPPGLGGVPAPAAAAAAPADPARKPAPAWLKIGGAGARARAAGGLPAWFTGRRTCTLPREAGCSGEEAARLLAALRGGGHAMDGRPWPAGARALAGFVVRAGARPNVLPRGLRAIDLGAWRGESAADAVARWVYRVLSRSIRVRDVVKAVVLATGGQYRGHCGGRKRGAVVARAAA
jgi:hypothetical protein